MVSERIRSLKFYVLGFPCIWIPVAFAVAYLLWAPGEIIRLIMAPVLDGGIKP